MALDTPAKRSSAIGLGLPWRAQFPFPDGAISAADRQHIARLYSGIPADAASVDTPLEWITFTGGSALPLAPGEWEGRFEPGASTTTTIAALKVGHAYLFRARAINSIGVRSAWSTQVAVRIPMQPLVQTTGIAVGAATDVLTPTVVNSDTHTTTASVFTHERILGSKTYVNSTGGNVDIEINLTSHRRVTTPGGVTSLDAHALLTVTETGPDLPQQGILVGPLASTLGNIENMGPSTSQVFNEAHRWSLQLADGNSIEAHSYLYFTGAVAGVVLETSDLALNMTIVKR